MAYLLNQASNLRVCVELIARLSDGVRSPAALACNFGVQAYRHPAPGIAAGVDAASLPGEGHEVTPPQVGSFEWLVALRSVSVLDLELIELIERIERLLARLAGGAGAGEEMGTGDEPDRSASLELHGETELGLRIQLAGEAVLVECGLDLSAALERVGALRAERGTDLALFRFAANPRALLAFSAGLIEELGRFPTDPAAVHPGAAT